MNVGDPCWRGADGVAAMELPWRVVMPDGSTRTDPSQWSEEPDVLAATGWARSTLTAEDVAAMTPAVPEVPGWPTPAGWKLGVTSGDVAMLTGLYVLAARREQLGVSRPVVITDTAGTTHEMTFAEFDALMLAYGAAVEASYGAS